MRIVCIGDSITAGQHLPMTDEPWPRHLRGRHHVIAAGVPGDTTRLGLERFPRDVQSLEPDAVVIQFGHNDANRWLTDRGLPRVSVAAYAANLLEMIRRVRTFHGTPILCTLTPSLRSERHALDCKRYDEALRKVAGLRRVRIADMGDFDPGLLLDGLHLSPEGHRIYAARVQEALP